MLVIGLTGGIGCGKSSICRLFTDLGTPTINADDITHELEAKDGDAYQEILEHFGEEYLNGNGELDRRKLRTTIFENSEARAWLEDLLHPLVFNEIKQRLSTLETPYVIVEIPLIDKIPEHNVIDRILFVDAPDTIQIQRTSLRDNFSREEIKKIMETQMDREELFALSDDIICNNGNDQHLKEEVQRLHERYLELGNGV